MHEKTQRAMARLMFVLRCAVSTLMTLSVILFMWTTWYHNRCKTQIAAKLGDETGLLVEIEDFDRATPLALHLNGARIFDSETGREVASVRRVTCAATYDEIVFVLRQPEMQSSELHHAWKLIHDRFLCRPDQIELPVRLVATDLAIHSKALLLTPQDVDGLVTPQERKTLANFVCFPADSANRSLVTINFRRDRSGDVPTTSTHTCNANFERNDRSKQPNSLCLVESVPISFQ